MKHDLKEILKSEYLLLYRKDLRENICIKPESIILMENCNAYSVIISDHCGDLLKFYPEAFTHGDRNVLKVSIGTIIMAEPIDVKEYHENLLNGIAKTAKVYVERGFHSWDMCTKIPRYYNARVQDFRQPTFNTLVDEIKFARMSTTNKDEE